MSCKGSCKLWNDAKGFGFIVPEGGGDDVFVHRADLVDADALNQGDEVTYESIFDDAKGKYRAEKVTGGTGKKGAGKSAPTGNGTHWGTVKSWNDTKGYGFIETDGEEGDAFVHRNDLMCDGLVPGDKVNYDRELDPQRGKPVAKKVTGGTGRKADFKGKGKGDMGGYGGGYGAGGGYGRGPY